MKAKDLIKELQTNYEPEDELAIHIWDINDVDSATPKEVSKEIKEQIIQEFHASLDSNYGLTWDGLLEAIDIVTGG